LWLLPPLLLVGEGEARQALKETELAANASRTAVRVKELTNVLDKYPLRQSSPLSACVAQKMNLVHIA
jgi:hypothetical protein